MERYSLNVVEVAKMLGISRQSAYNLAKSEGFPSVRVGRRLVIPRDAFLLWLEKKQAENVI